MTDEDVFAPGTPVAPSPLPIDADPDDPTGDAPEAYKAYAGIGSRRTPEHICAVMWQAGRRWAGEGWTLRSGGAERADAAFEDGCNAADGRKEIYRPADVQRLRANRADEAAYAEYVRLYGMSRDAHPNWAALKPYAQDLQMRNAFQVFGPHPAAQPVPVVFVAYWYDGQGGTGQAIRLAEKWNAGAYTARRPKWQIQLRNLHDPAVLARFLDVLGIDRAAYRAKWCLGADLRPPAGVWPGARPAPEPETDPFAPAAVAVPAAAAPVVWGVGHGSDSVPAFVRRLLNHGISVVVDVRPPGAGPAWHDPAELTTVLEDNQIRYQRAPKLASPEPRTQAAGVAVLIRYAKAYPDERVALLDRAAYPTQQTQLRRLIPLARAGGVSVRLIQADGTDAPA